jgi:hypothetical protein
MCNIYKMAVDRLLGAFCLSISVFSLYLDSFIPLRLFKMLNSSTGALHHHADEAGSLQSLQLPPALNQSLPRAGLPHLGKLPPVFPAHPQLTSVRA